MRKSVLLFSAVLLAFGASARADGIGMNYASVSMSVVQSSGYDACVLPSVCPRPIMILPLICTPSPVIVLFPSPSPCMILSPHVGLVGSPCILPNPSLMVLGAQVSMAAVGHDMAVAVIMNMR